MEAIVLAGGFGTRLKSVVADVPKPMARVAGKPFLEYILNYLKSNGIKRVVLAVGYKKDVITNYFGNSFNGLEIEYSIEEEPLGTGGGVKLAMSKCLQKNVFVVNGDTYFPVDLSDMMNHHVKNAADITIATKRMKNFDRYGTIDVVKGKIVSFNEKRFCKNGLINGGIYVMKNNILGSIKKNVFSMEKDFFQHSSLRIFSYLSNSYFIDIGIPEDYYKAQKEFKICKRNYEE